MLRRGNDPRGAPRRRGVGSDRNPVCTTASSRQPPGTWARDPSARTTGGQTTHRHPPSAGQGAVPGRATSARQWVRADAAPPDDAGYRRPVSGVPATVHALSPSGRPRPPHIRGIPTPPGHSVRPIVLKPASRLRRGRESQTTGPMEGVRPHGIRSKRGPVRSAPRPLRSPRKPANLRQRGKSAEMVLWGTGNVPRRTAAARTPPAGKGGESPPKGSPECSCPTKTTPGSD